MPTARLAGQRSAATKTQRWFHDLSSHLEVSFRGSAQIKHQVTKGQSREHQILDALERLLPTRLAVARNVVIVDSEDVESRKFDGVLLDRTTWPLLYVQDTTQIAMMESVVAAIEVKSSLASGELKDICAKTAVLRSMRCTGQDPMITAFAYECANPNLSFFDFASTSRDSPSSVANVVCILNCCLFGLAEPGTGALFPVSDPAEGTPVLLRSGKDALLLFVYILSRWASPSSPTIKTFERYSQSLFANANAFYFHDDFLDAVTSEQKAHSAARECFMRRSRRDIKELYGLARDVLGLPPA